MPIQSYTFHWTKPWINLLILWAIHGNEPCGPVAIQRIINEIENNQIEIKTWSVTFIPVCNPEAYKQNKRYIDANLNRIFKPGYDTTSYESYLAEMVRWYIDQTDYMIDIHSLSWWDDVFLFKSDYNDKDINIFAQATGVEQVIKWRDTVYKQTQERTTDDYIRSIWKKGICIECWQHEDPNAPIIAYNAIINCMKHLQITAWEASYNKKQYTYNMQKLYYKEQEGTFTQHRKHGDFIKAWTIIAIYNDDSEIIAKKDGYILLPKHRAKQWEERFYLWIKE